MYVGCIGQYDSCNCPRKHHLLQKLYYGILFRKHGHKQTTFPEKYIQVTYFVACQ